MINHHSLESHVNLTYCSVHFTTWLQHDNYHYYDYFWGLSPATSRHSPLSTLPSLHKLYSPKCILLFCTSTPVVRLKLLFLLTFPVFSPYQTTTPMQLRWHLFLSPSHVVSHLHLPWNNKHLKHIHQVSLILKTLKSSRRYFKIFKSQ